MVLKESKRSRLTIVRYSGEDETLLRPEILGCSSASLHDVQLAGLDVLSFLDEGGGVGFHNLIGKEGVGR